MCAKTFPDNGTCFTYILKKLIGGSPRETVKTGMEDFIKNLSDTKRVAVNYFQILEIFSLRVS